MIEKANCEFHCIFLQRIACEQYIAQRTERYCRSVELVRHVDVLTDLRLHAAASMMLCCCVACTRFCTCIIDDVTLTRSSHHASSCSVKNVIRSLWSGLHVVHVDPPLASFCRMMHPNATSVEHILTTARPDCMPAVGYGDYSLATEVNSSFRIPTPNIERLAENGVQVSGAIEDMCRHFDSTSYVVGCLIARRQS